MHPEALSCPNPATACFGIAVAWGLAVAAAPIYKASLLGNGGDIRSLIATVESDGEEAARNETEGVEQ